MPVARVLAVVSLVVACATDAHAGRPPAPGDRAGAAAVGEAVRRGIVGVERRGRTVGLGTVLAGDGRVLTARSVLGESTEADVRYADGTLARARVGHHDVAHDLALLVPLSGKRTEGLRASEVEPSTTELLTFGGPRGAGPTPLRARIKGKSMAQASRDDGTATVFDVEVRGASPAVGAPLVDASGAVVAVLSRVCMLGDAAACTPTLAGTPIDTIRRFLAATPSDAVAPTPFLGIVGVPHAEGPVHGVRVAAVAPGSSADKAGLKVDIDVIVAVDGAPVDTPERLAEYIGRHGVGDRVKLFVFGPDKLREVIVALRAAP